MPLFPRAVPAPPFLKAVTEIRVIRFGMVGVINTLIDLVLFSLLVHGAAIAVVPANILSYGTGILNSFLLNRAWTFNDRSRGRALFRSLALFIGINLLGLAFSTLLVALFSQVASPVLAKAMSVPLVFVWNYLASRHLAFDRAAADDLAPARG